MILKNFRIQEFYSDADLKIGNVINIFGRPLKLVGCDEFTKNHYREKFAIEDFPSLENKADRPPVPPIEKIQEII